MYSVMITNITIYFMTPLDLKSLLNSPKKKNKIK